MDGANAMGLVGLLNKAMEQITNTSGISVLLGPVDPWEKYIGGGFLGVVSALLGEKVKLERTITDTTSVPPLILNCALPPKYTDHGILYVSFQIEFFPDGTPVIPQAEMLFEEIGKTKQRKGLNVNYINATPLKMEKKSPNKVIIHNHLPFLYSFLPDGFFANVMGLSTLCFMDNTMYNGESIHDKAKRIILEEAKKKLGKDVEITGGPVIRGGLDRHTKFEYPLTFEYFVDEATIYKVNGKGLVKVEWPSNREERIISDPIKDVYISL